MKTLRLLLVIMISSITLNLYSVNVSPQNFKAKNDSTLTEKIKISDKVIEKVEVKFGAATIDTRVATALLCLFTSIIAIVLFPLDLITIPASLVLIFSEKTKNHPEQKRIKIISVLTLIISLIPAMWLMFVIMNMGGGA